MDYFTLILLLCFSANRNYLIASFAGASRHYVLPGEEEEPDEFAISSSAARAKIFDKKVPRLQNAITNLEPERASESVCGLGIRISSRGGVLGSPPSHCARGAIRDH